MVDVVKKMILASLEEAHDKLQQVRKYSRFTLLSSAILITFSLLLFAVQYSEDPNHVLMIKRLSYRDKNQHET